MYYKYWNLKKPPFDNVPDPSMYVETHATVENAIAETIFAIEEGEECIAVIAGDVGLGKTLSIRIIIDSLDQKKYKIALVTNPDMSFVQLLREMIGQLTGKQCDEKRKVDLLEVFNKLLFETIDEGKKIIIFIDEANAMSPANLESLRLLTNMQDDNKNLFTIVLAGQLELARRLEHPKRANLFQRIGIYCKLDKIESEDLVRNYIETRLKLTGATKKIFTDDAISAIYEYSENGVPRLVNKICKLCLKAGETNNFKEISSEIVSQIGERFQRLSGPIIQERAVRKKTVRGKIEDSKEEQKPGLNDSKENEEQPIHDDLETTPPKAASQESDLDSEKVSTKPKAGKLKIKVKIPPHIIQQAKSFSKEYRYKLAGILAAQALKKHSELNISPSDDPLSVWNKAKNTILTEIERQIENIEE